MEIWAAFVLGAISSFHCIGMCGPIAFALPLNRKNRWTQYFGIAIYTIGRLITYSTLGILFGLLGKGLFTAGFQRGLSIAVGVFFLVSVIVSFYNRKSYNFENIFVGYLGKVKHLIRNQFKNQSSISLFTIGVFNGLLPCGMVYLALAGAIAIGTPLGSAQFMFFFGTGTAPMMLIASLIGNQISIQFRNRVKTLVPYFVAIMGVLFILRGLNLDIPYISPEINRVEPGVTVCD